MGAAKKLPDLYKETGPDDRAPVVTLIGSNLPQAYLDEAEPSPLMESASRLWRRIVFAFKLIIVLLLVGGYPAMMAASHKIDTREVVLSQAAPWASPEAGTAMTLIGRELTGAGWADDRAAWHPAAQLKALPAWQEGLISALSEHTALMAQLTPNELGQPDADLNAAGRLLAPASDSEGTPRLNAAAEAIQRYEGRLSRGLVSAPRGIEAFQAEAKLMASWAAASEQILRDSANSAQAWPASRRDVEAIYLARAKAHVAGQMLSATLSAEPELLASRDAVEARDRALMAWRRAATFNPLIVSSQAGTGRILSDHPAVMTFYMQEAEAAMMALIAAVEPQPVAPETVSDGATAP